MLKKPKSLGKRVLFNASVVIAGHYSLNGGSAKLLSWVASKKIVGVISETILDEVNRHVPGHTNIFEIIAPAPNANIVRKRQQIVVDPGDAHLLATADETAPDFLVSLDKKHILLLRSKIKKPKIVSPKELIEILS